MNIFSGIKVLDLSRVFSGPFATRHFADFVAEVIKIEPPSGDDSRHFPPLKNNWSGYFELLNRNKKSVFLNLKLERDLNKFYKLCHSADIVVENFTPGITKKLKVDYECLKKINKRLIYASVVGVNEDTHIRYYDVIGQAESGLISLNGKDDDMKISTSIVDAFSGMKLAFALSSALYKREKSGRGMKVTVSMRGSAFDLLEQNLIETSLTGRDPEKVGNHDNAIAPFGVYRTKDSNIVLAVGNNNLWDKLSMFLARESKEFKSNMYTTNESRLQNSKQLTKDIELVFSKYKTMDLLNILTSLGIPNGKVNKMTDLLEIDENFNKGLLKKVNIKNLGNVVVATGGVFFDKFPIEDYKAAPNLEKNEI